MKEAKNVVYSRPAVMSVREFKANWTRLGDAVIRVEARGRLIGHWVPAANSLRWSDDRESPVESN